MEICCCRLKKQCSLAYCLLAGFCFFFLLLSPTKIVVQAQLDCSKAPTSALRTVCDQIQRWDKNARDAPPVAEAIPLPPAIPGLPAPSLAGDIAAVASTAYQCMDLGCLCNYLGGNGQTGTNTCSMQNGQPLRKSVRKEYRMLSDEERARFHAAYLAVKRNGEYDKVAALHSQWATSGSAHSGPGFLGWHREFVKRFEISLRQIDPSVSLPYWDSSLEVALPTPKDSIMFTDMFMGETDSGGNLVKGDFAGWRTLNGRANVVRNVGVDGNGFREQDIQWVLRQTNIEMVLGFTAPRQGCTVQSTFELLEFTHGVVHIFVGGDMGDTSTAANDPIFFLHHAFVDHIWEMWRSARQSRNDRETMYPLDMAQCEAPQHFASAKMRPFEPWNNIDGLNNSYTDNMYEYAPRPSCSMGPNCGSKYLFCDRSHREPRCAAKIRIGGNCAGFNRGEDCCYSGVCQDGKCVQTSSVTTTPRPVTRPTPTPPPKTIACHNEHECCAIWANKGECQRNPNYMNAWCEASCQQCRPEYNLAIECGDRHRNCRKWANQGGCQQNQFWMTENCRQSCGRCSVTRAQVCGGGRGSQSNQGRVTQAPPRQGRCKSQGCFNENICCQYWSAIGECHKNQDWMSCNCKVSCGACVSDDYEYGTCSDYHNQCQEWANQGECEKNAWMMENCRSSCDTCISSNQLRQLCRNSAAGGGRFVRDQSSVSLLVSQPFIENDDFSIARIEREAVLSPPPSASADKNDDRVVKLIRTQQKVPESGGMPSSG